jgi:AcrR family transcriptional regulator
VKGKPIPAMRNRIIDEGISLFLKTSFKATSIQDITDRLGITKGAFYWHFKSKEELLHTIIEKYDQEFLSQLYIHMASYDGNFPKRFREYHKYINEYAKEHGELCVLFVTLAAEMAGSQTEAERKINAIQKRYREFIESLLEAGKKEQLFASEYNIVLNAHIIVAIHSGILLEWYMNRTDINGSAMARTYRDIILYGMVKKG